MLYYLILFLFIALIICVASVVYGEIKKYQWLNKYLNKPYKVYKKNNSFFLDADLQQYGVSVDSQLAVKYYESFSPKILEKILLTIRLKSKNEIANKSFLSLLTAGIMPLISLLLAVIALFSNSLSSDHVFLIVATLMAMLVPAILIIGLNYFSDHFISTITEKHILAIEEALKVKERTRSRSRRR
ncbi:hypothetical protein [Paenibacillus sp. NFR01]|uniref:hypothetical protein n=1 Tax=Paenibacillus sp. NFR01 TaxID=1566279 RepID=UPI0008ABF9B2|nr:hypothetical protein [Paenibacillus sp. NFR01]SEU32425.1 hypothetical protein SAMN03159358_0121 [Paenibacillus sp. NFR01]